MNRLKAWLNDWLGITASLQFHAGRIRALELENEALKAKIEAQTIMRVIAEQPQGKVKLPFNLQPVPFRKKRAMLEQTLDPEYQLMQQRLRDEEAKKPHAAK